MDWAVFCDVLQSLDPDFCSSASLSTPGFTQCLQTIAQTWPQPIEDLCSKSQPGSPDCSNCSWLLAEIDFRSHRGLSVSFFPRWNSSLCFQFHVCCSPRHGCPAKRATLALLRSWRRQASGHRQGRRAGKGGGGACGASKTHCM